MTDSVAVEFRCESVIEPDKPNESMLEIPPVCTVNSTPDIEYNLMEWRV